MALTLNEYIKMSYKRPNKAILRGLGASEELIEYLCETPENTNWNILKNLTIENKEESLPKVITFDPSTGSPIIEESSFLNASEAFNWCIENKDENNTISSDKIIFKGTNGLIFNEGHFLNDQMWLWNDLNDYGNVTISADSEDSWFLVFY